MRALFFWMGLQMLLGTWIFISPYVFGAAGRSAAVNDMICGAAVVLLGAIIFIYEFYRPAPRPGMSPEKKSSSSANPNA